MSVPVGITVPKLLPITGTFAPLFATYYTVLCVRVSQIRLQSEKFIGASSTSEDPASDPLLISTRCQGNFAESVPLALFLGAVVEMNGGNRKALTAGFSWLFLMRLLHVELGMRGEGTRAIGRPIGHIGTIGFIVGMGGYAAYLVKGYWGF